MTYKISDLVFTNINGRFSGCVNKIIKIEDLIDPVSQEILLKNGLGTLHTKEQIILSPDYIKKIPDKYNVYIFNPNYQYKLYGFGNNPDNHFYLNDYFANPKSILKILFGGFLKHSGIDRLIIEDNKKKLQIYDNTFFHKEILNLIKKNT